ncbi:hypothetical protein [Mycolicibacterium vinylchloridicum]|uniref:hypothetical protein n=1 Tax=Mycolicibacterium vinylchloridicum TaxID=2736928 RepID=UPI0015C9AEC7|nr:hypothetical protein [Mycolicibacterium vinylchloridicum]
MGALLAVAVASGVSATSAIGTAPAANATCASFFGLGNTGDCSSGFGSIAIAIGSNAIARADGVLGAAIALGDLSYATATPGSVFTLASAMGTRALAQVNGFLGAAVSAGNRGGSNVGIGPGALQFGNVAINLGSHVSELTNEVSASGFGNLAVNMGGNVVFVEVTGLLNNATNLFGSTDIQVAGGALSWAFNVLGEGNQVTAGPGFLAVAGSLGQTGATVKQAPFGININGAAIPPAAAAAHQAALRNNRKSVAPKPNQSTSAKAPKRGTARSARG